MGFFCVCMSLSVCVLNKEIYVLLSSCDCAKDVGIKEKKKITRANRQGRGKALSRTLEQNEPVNSTQKRHTLCETRRKRKTKKAAQECTSKSGQTEIVDVIQNTTNKQLTGFSASNASCGVRSPRLLLLLSSLDGYALR